MASILQSLTTDDDGANPMDKRKRPQAPEAEEVENQNIPNDIPANPLAPPPRKRQKLLTKGKAKATRAAKV